MTGRTDLDHAINHPLFLKIRALFWHGLAERTDLDHAINHPLFLSIRALRQRDAPNILDAAWRIIRALSPHI